MTIVVYSGINMNVTVYLIPKSNLTACVGVSHDGTFKLSKLRGATGRGIIPVKIKKISSRCKCSVIDGGSFISVVAVATSDPLRERTGRTAVVPVARVAFERNVTVAAFGLVFTASAISDEIAHFLNGQAITVGTLIRT